MTIRLRFIHKHWCIQCRDWTDHEREATLPPQYKCGDPDYEDRTKCGRCGETYQCDECGCPWDVDAEQCEAVIDHGYHGPDVGPLCELIADGTPWQDGDGAVSWPETEANELAAHVESLGYRVQVRPV
jgi:hypothetical protein